MFTHAACHIRYLSSYGLVGHDVRRLAYVLAVAILLAPGLAHAVPVNPTPVPSPTFNGPVHAVAYWGNVIYVGGEFTVAIVNGKRFKRSRLAAVDAATGALLDWAPSADRLVNGIAADASGVYIGGDFQSVNLQSRDSLAKLDLVTGKLLSGFRHRINGHVNTLHLAYGRVYLGGSLTSVSGVARTAVAAFDAATGALDMEWAPALNGPVYSLASDASRIYLGGLFTSVNGTERTQKLAAVTPDTAAVDATFVSRVHAFVGAIDVQAGTLYAGIDGDGGRMTAMDLTGTPKWTVTLDGDVSAIAVLGDTVYLGGHFDNVCKTDKVGTVPGLRGSHCTEGSDPRIKLAAVDLAGTLLPWTADGSGRIGVMALVANPASGRVAAGGTFRTINGAPQRGFVLFGLTG